MIELAEVATLVQIALQLEKRNPSDICTFAEYERHSLGSVNSLDSSVVSNKNCLAA